MTIRFVTLQRAPPLTSILAPTRGAPSRHRTRSDRFARALAPLGLPTLDLLPVLRAEPEPAGLFFRENIHFTPRGHQVVADSLEGFLRGAGLLAGGGAFQARGRDAVPRETGLAK